MSRTRIELPEDHEFEIGGIAFGGQGICRYEDFVVFVKGAVPGDRIRLRITKKKKNFAEAVIREIVRPSENRVPAPCPHAGVCGGCTWQHVNYPSQLEYKRSMIADVFERIGEINNPVIPLPLSPGSVFHYRNKMEFTFNDRAWLTPEQIADPEFTAPDFALGLHVPGRFDKVLPIQTCYLQSERANRALRAVADFTRSSGLPPYSATEQTGFWRFLVIREAAGTGELMLHIITYDTHPEIMDEFRKFILPKVEGITSLIHSVNSRKSQVAVGDESFCLYGSPVLKERLLDNLFHIDPHAFFQTNTAGADRLYRAIIELAGFSGNEEVYDLYCGAGSITISIAPHVRHVTGVELVPQAVANAVHNAELNGISNCAFIAGDIKDTLTQNAIRADAVILDPPRSGLHPEAVQLLSRYAPEKIIYVSCNPATQARDIQMLSGRYHIAAIQPVDMFPHTYHVENIAVLMRTRG